jgi:plastocyanin
LDVVLRGAGPGIMHRLRSLEWLIRENCQQERGQQMTRHSLVAVGACLLLGMACWPGLAGPTGRARAAEPVWVRWDPSSNTASVTIQAAYNEVGSGFNFDGYNMGHLTIIVPLRAKVVVDFTNRSDVPHSVVITAYNLRSSVGPFPPAFPGASIPNPSAGVANLKVPEVFSFTASKVGTYAMVCGVPGHAVGGMWDVFQVANVATASEETTGTGSTGAPIMTMPIPGDGVTGAVEGTVTDATSGKPIAHAFMVLGWTTLKRVGETDASGHYRIDHVQPVSLTDAYGFAEGYVYYHGHPIPIKAGQVTEYSFAMPRETFPKDLLPTVTGATISMTAAKAGDTVTFSAHIRPGKGGPLSAEEFAVDGPLSVSVLLAHVGSDVYRGTWQVPAGVTPGTYDFAFFGAMENCLENQPYQHVTLKITG